MLSLYANISRVTWNLGEAEHVVAGTVSHPRAPAGGDLRPFTLNGAAMSQTQIVNALWDML